MQDISTDEKKFENKKLEININKSSIQKNQEIENKDNKILKNLAKKNITSLMKGILANQLISKSKIEHKIKKEEKKDTITKEIKNIHPSKEDQSKKYKVNKIYKKNEQVLENIIPQKILETTQKNQILQESQKPITKNLSKNQNYIFKNVTLNNKTILNPQNNDYRSRLTQSKTNKNSHIISNHVNLLKKDNKILNSTTKYRIITRNEYEILLKDPSVKIIDEGPNFDYKNRSKTRDLKKDFHQNNFFNNKQTVVKSSNRYNVRNISKSQIGQKRFINSTQTSRKFIQTSTSKNNQNLNTQKFYYNKNNNVRTTTNPLYKNYGSKSVIKNNGSNIYQSSIEMYKN